MKPMYINGQGVTVSDGKTIEVFNPATDIAAAMHNLPSLFEMRLSK